MERSRPYNLKRSRPDGELDDIDQISKPTQRVLTKEQFYGLEKDFFGNLVKKNKLTIKTAEYNFDREKIMQEYQKNLDNVKSVEDYYAREKIVIREAYAIRQRRKMLPEQNNK